MSEQYRAGRFYSSLNGNLPVGDLGSQTFGGSLSVFSTNPRGQPGRTVPFTTDPSNLAMESVQWDKSTYVLPTVLPPTASSELRSRVFALTLKTLQRSTRGDYATKAALLEQRFQCASAATRARTIAAPAKNIIGGAYTFEDPLIKRSSGALLNVSEPPSDNDRRNAKYLEFRATFRPLTLSPDLTDPPQSFVTAIRLPRNPETDLIADVFTTKALLTNAQFAMANIFQSTAALPELLELGEQQNGRLQLDEQASPRRMLSFYDKVYFDVLQKEIAKDYVGDAIQNAQAVVQNTKQVRFVNGRQITDHIEVYLKRFASAVDLLDEDKPYPIDIVSTCHQNMSEITRKQIKTLGWTEPTKAASNAGQHEQLSKLRAVAIRAEEAIQTTRLVAATRRPQSFSTTAYPTVPIFMAGTDGEEVDPTTLPPVPEVQVTRPPGLPPPDMDGTVATGVSTLAADRTFLPQAQPPLAHPVPQSVLLEEAREFQIFMSNSEIAMRTAAGEENKLCWGGCYKFFPGDSDGKHTYSSCPFRRVDRVREHALPYLKQFRQNNGPLNRRVSSMLADPDKLTAAFCQPIVNDGGITRQHLEDLQVNWQEKGFASAEMARSICFMVDPSTTKKGRETEAATMKNKIIRAASNKRRREQERAELRSLRSQASLATANTGQQGRDNRDNNDNSFILVTLPIFSTEIDHTGREPVTKPAVNMPSLLRMSQALPHIDVPIGTGPNKDLKLRAVFDSGAGLNVGRRNYHENIRKQYPHVVKRYVDLQQENFDTPAIGGIDGNAYGSSVTALISYYTPFKTNGRPVEISFGLVDGLCAKSIIGITTMQKARMNYLVGSQVVTSEEFGYTFPVTMQKPTVDDAPPHWVEGNAAVLRAGPHHE